MKMFQREIQGLRVRSFNFSRWVRANRSADRDQFAFSKLSFPSSMKVFFEGTGRRVAIGYFFPFFFYSPSLKFKN